MFPKEARHATRMARVLTQVLHFADRGGNLSPKRGTRGPASLVILAALLLFAVSVLVLQSIAAYLLLVVVALGVLLLLIYALPGHGESLPSDEPRFCWRCGRRVHRMPGTDSWYCPACGNVQQLGPRS